MHTILVLLVTLMGSNAVAQDLADMNTLATSVAITLSGNPAKRGIQPYTLPEFTVTVIESNEVNAFGSPQSKVVTITSAMLQILKDDRGELAFVIAHELGHIQDAGCHERGATQGLSGNALQRMCESAADGIGVQYLMAAGYSPFEASGVMGKLLMANPDQTSIMGIFVGRFASNHPVDVDRIRGIAFYAARTCQERPDVCSAPSPNAEDDAEAALERDVAARYTIAPIKHRQTPQEFANEQIKQVPKDAENIRHFYSSQPSSVWPVLLGSAGILIGIVIGWLAKPKRAT